MRTVKRHGLRTMLARVFAAAMIFVLVAPGAFAKTVTIPVTLDLAFLHTALTNAVFNDTTKPTSVWTDGSGCNYLNLDDPQLTIVNGRLRLQANGTARVGTPVTRTRCIVALDWQGITQLDQQPVLSTDGRRLQFRVTDSRLLESDMSSRLTSDAAWSLVKQHIHPRIEGIEIDLSATITELQSVLALFMPKNNQTQMQELLDSIRLSDVGIVKQGIRAGVEITAPDVAPVTDADQPSEPAFSAEELARWRQRSQTFDAFLTIIIKSAAGWTQTPELRAELLDVLIDARYAIEHALANAQPVRADPIRALFVRSWQRLTPVLARIDNERESGQSMRFLAFIAAGDALTALDELGPASGIEISTDGLRRLARVLVDEDTELPFNYHLDPKLRELFLIGAPPTANDEGAWLTPQPRWAGWLIADAQANADEPDSALDRWVPTAKDAANYLPLVGELLARTAERTLASHPVDEVFAEVFPPLVLATAWQESCWRQWVNKDGETTPITSSAGAVGLMQVLPPVWRGFYDPTMLHQDIQYNATAGAEILNLYLTRYAIKKKEYEHPGGLNNLARATYAAYNGGPRHLTRYRKDETSQSLKDIDQSFYAKYETMRAGQTDAVLTCFGL